MSDIVTRARELLAGITGPWRWSGGEGDDPNRVFIDAAPQLVTELANQVERLRGCPHDSWSGDGKGRWRCDECGADQGSQSVSDVVAQLEAARAEVERLRAREREVHGTAQQVVQMFRDIEGMQLYYAPLHRMVDLLAKTLEADHG